MKSSKKAECYADIFAKKEVRYTSQTVDKARINFVDFGLFSLN